MTKYRNCGGGSFRSYCVRCMGPCRARRWVAPTVRRFAAGDAEGPGAETAVD